MPASLREVADRAGVSLATASRALNGRGGVKSETRQRVLEVAQELQFSFSMAARGLVTTRTETICYVVHQRHAPFDGDPFYPIIMHGVEAELRRHDYHLLLSTISDEQFKDVSTFKPVAEQRVDGVLLAGPDISPRFILALKQLEVPVLLIDNVLENGTIDAVYSDDIQGGRLATRHLLEHGHSKIVALLGPDAWASSAHRGQGYRETMIAAGLVPQIFHAEDTTMETGSNMMQQALLAVPDLTAIFAANDAMALGAMRVLTQQKRRVPKDVAVIGFDDTAYSALVDPPLSTVKIFKHEMGRAAARRMLTMLTEEDGGPAMQTVLATELVLRRSCGCEDQPL
jgi:LacI family transcriptional regulator